MFEVHVYTVEGVYGFIFKSSAYAKRLARVIFKAESVYKVKVWDLNKGEPVPNAVDPPGLIYEIV